MSTNVTPFTKARCQEYTAQALWRIMERLRVADKLRQDKDAKARRARFLCKACHYMPRIGGAAMTKSSCSICGQDIVTGSTVTNLLCQSCAEKHSLCCRCGADLELRPRRRKFEFD